MYLKSAYARMEMQVEFTETLLRARYYHSHMDMELLPAGTKYDQLPDSYVIFICDHDPFGKKKYQYTIEQHCLEAPELDVKAGIHTIILSTKGENDEDVSEELRKFLKYVGSKLENSEEDFEDAYVGKLQNAVQRIKQDRELGDRYMLFEELLSEVEKKAVAKGIEQGIAEAVYQSVYEGDYPLERGAEKLQKTVEEFSQCFEQWKAANNK